MTHQLTKVLLFVATSLVLFSACRDTDTYAERREKEDKQIQAFLRRGCVVRDKIHGFDVLNVPGNIKVISEAQFLAQDTTTDVSKNEYVLFGTGVYMQIIRKGTGTRIASGERTSVISRFTEFSIAGDSITTSNLLDHPERPDLISVNNNSGTLNGVFVSGLMYSTYGSAVPSAWLLPLRYLNIGRQHSADSQIAKIRLIVPGNEGQKVAINDVKPYFYEITYERAR